MVLLQSTADQLTEDDLEQLIDAFEKAKHAHLEQQHADWNKKGSSSLAVPPEDRAPAEIYPASKAIQVTSPPLSTLLVLRSYAGMLAQ